MDFGDLILFPCHWVLSQIAPPPSSLLPPPPFLLASSSHPLHLLCAAAAAGGDGGGGERPKTQQNAIDLGTSQTNVVQRIDLPRQYAWSVPRGFGHDVERAFPCCPH